MALDSYDCELCILQEEESLDHLFLKCNFAKRCWQVIGISFSTHLRPLQIIKVIKRKLKVPFFMEIIICMAWSIWMQRNDWLFKGEDPTVDKCKEHFLQEFAMVIHRAKAKIPPRN